jgi:hypothetical protein
MKRWNIAGDYVINDLLVKDGIGKMPECALYDPQLVIDGGGTTDGVYNLLPEGADGGHEDGGTGIDVCMDSDGDDAEQAEAEASMKVQVAQAAQAAFIEIEVETLEQLREALDADARMVLLDNMDLATLRAAVAINAGRTVLEVSGGVNMDTVRAIAATGVDRISIGTLTKDIRAIDFSMRLEELP